MSQILTFPAVNYKLPPIYQKRQIRNLLYPLNEYFPYQLADDIANIASYWKYKNEQAHGFIGQKSDFNNEYQQFLYSITFDLYKEQAPYYLAVRIIRSLSRKHNLRKLEKAIIAGDPTFSFKEHEVKFNPKVDLTDFKQQTLDIVEVKEDEIIEFNILQQLKIVNKLNKGFKLNLSRNEKMRQYSQIKHIPKYQLLLPTFDYKFTLKQFKVPEISTRKIVLFRDLSMSSKKYDYAFKGILLYFLNNYNREVLIIQEFTNTIINIETIDSWEKLKKYYLKSVVFEYATFEFKNSFIANTKECFIVSSGKEDIFPQFLPHTIVHGIGGTQNSTLETLCENTKGIFIQL